MNQPRDPLELQRFLEDRDIPCPGCGYSLRGLHGDRCPECNRLLRLAVAAVDAGVGPLIAAALGLGSSGAAAVALLAVVACLCISEMDLPRNDEFVVLVLAPGVIVAVSGAGVLALASRTIRSRFLRKPRPTQAWLAVACWGISATIFVIWYRLLRAIL